MNGPLAWIVRRSCPLASYEGVGPALATRSSRFATAPSSNFTNAMSVGSGRRRRSRPSAAVDGLDFTILLRNSSLAAGGRRGDSCPCLGEFVGPAMVRSPVAFGSWRTAGVAACSIFVAAPLRSRSSSLSCFACPAGCPRQRNAPPIATAALTLCAWSRRGHHAEDVSCLNRPAFAVRALPAS